MPIHAGFFNYIILILLFISWGSLRAENAIRPYVVGRKNWLFSHTPSGAHASAAIYSLIETAKANGLSPYEYLQFVFETLPTLGEDDDLDALLPWRWKDTLPA